MLSVSFAGPTALPLDPTVLACIQCGRDGAVSADPRIIRIGVNGLGDCPDELWRGATPASSGTRNGFSFASNGEHLFGHRRVAERELDDIAAATHLLYTELNAFLKLQGFPWLLRSWNYIHDIHRGDGDGERYKQFCLGRHQAVAAVPGYERALPAATVIGTPEPGMLIFFLAGKVPGQQVENPRQTPAFRYPREYGPASPSFSRATLLPSERLLLMSGTASVVGHATRHPHDSKGQLDEMLTNVQALLRHTSDHHASGATWSARVLRVFLRDRADLLLAQARTEQVLGPDAPLIFMEGDICRTDLRLEIEGVFSAAGISR